MKRYLTNPYYLVAAFSTLFFCMVLVNISTKSLSCDEILYIPAGYSYLKTFDYWMNREHPPLAKLLAGIPLLFLQPNLSTESPLWGARDKQLEFGRDFLFVQNKNTDQLIFWARVSMALLGVLLGIYVFLFARDLYGLAAGYFALLLASFEPNILAQAGLATTDIGVTSFSFIAVYYLWKCLYRGQRHALWLAGVFLGLSLATKFTAIYLIPVFALLAGLHVYWQHRPNTPPSYKAILWRPVSQNLLRIFTVALGVVLLTYGVIHFDRFIAGLRFQFLHDQSGHPAFLMGEHSMGGWPHYFLVAFLIKTPVGLLLVIALTCLCYHKLNPQITKSLQRDLFLLLPVGVILGAAVLSRLNIGIRYIVPMFPFLFVFVSQVVLLDWNRLTKYVVLGVLTGWFVIASLRIAPHYLTYFNEIVGGPDKGYHYLIDSNIDEGQDLKLLAAYMHNHHIDKIKLSYFGVDSCSYRDIRCEELGCTPQPGTLAVSVNNLVGVTPAQAKCFAWLRDFRPIQKIGHSIFVYDVTESALAHPLGRFPPDPAARSGRDCQPHD